jgi:exosortase/archaeosortase family protein
MRRVAAFVVLFALLLGGYEAARGTWLERFVVEDATVATAAGVIRAIDPALPVRAEGARLVAPGGGLVVLAGCEGVDVLLLLTAAMAVAPMPWRARLAGLAAGTLLTFALNQARVVGLFYAFRADRELYASLHGVVTPLAMALAAGAFFVAWHARFARTRHSAAA